MQDGTESDSDADAETLTHTRLTVEDAAVSLRVFRLPEIGGRRETSWCFSRNVEHLLWGTERSSSNLLHCLEEMRNEGCQRHLTRASFADEGLSEEEFGALVTLFNTMRRELDPLASNKGRVVTVIPKQVCAHPSPRGLTQDAMAGGLCRGSAPHGTPSRWHQGAAGPRSSGSCPSTEPGRWLPRNRHP